MARPPRRLRDASMGVATASLAGALDKAGLERGPAGLEGPPSETTGQVGPTSESTGVVGPSSKRLWCGG
jgi:hypothetical protein